MNEKLEIIRRLELYYRNTIDELESKVKKLKELLDE
jgi:hypothetical protein